MEYSHDDAGLARQPIGYWSWAAHKAVVTHIRASLTALGLTQPGWWVLARLAESESGRERAELSRTLAGFLDIGEGLQPEIDALLDRGLIAKADGDVLTLTPAGAEVHAEATAVQRGNRARIHQGIPDEEYVAALKVLQRMIRNVEGEAWHE